MKPAWLAVIALIAGIVGGVTVIVAQMLIPGGGTPTPGGEVRAYLLEHPEVLPEAMQRLQERETGKAIAANRTAVLEPYPGAVGGNPKGDVTVAVYMDYACGYCRASLPVLAKLVASDSGVRVLYHELPILSRESRTAAQWALAAANQGKFKSFHDAMFAAGQLSPASIGAAAQKVGLDQARATRDQSSPRIAGEIAKNLEVAGKLGITGTPSWIIGNRVLSGAQPYEALAEAVKAARTK